MKASSWIALGLAAVLLLCIGLALGAGFLGRGFPGGMMRGWGGNGYPGGMMGGWAWGPGGLLAMGLMLLVPAGFLALLAVGIAWLVKGIAGGPGLAHLHYVDLRGTLSQQLQGQAYKSWWNDELHPTEQGFAKVAAKFDALIRRIA